MPFDAPGQVKLKQDDMHGSRRDGGKADDFVDLHRARSQRLEHAGPIAVVGLADRLA